MAKQKKKEAAAAAKIILLNLLVQSSDATNTTKMNPIVTKLPIQYPVMMSLLLTSVNMSLM